MQNYAENFPFKKIRKKIDSHRLSRVFYCRNLIFEVFLLQRMNLNAIWGQISIHNLKVFLFFISLKSVAYATNKKKGLIFNESLAKKGAHL